MIRCYLAGACKENSNPEEWREEAKDWELDIVKWVDPLDYHDGARDPAKPSDELVRDDLGLMLDCDAILTYRFPGMESWGAVTETWEAYRHGLFVAIVSPDDDLSKWAIEMADAVTHSISSGVARISKFAEDGVKRPSDQRI